MVRLGTLTLTPPAEVSGPVMLGIRPEDLEVAENGVGFAFRVHVPEPLGPHMLLTGDAEGQSMRVAVAPDRVVQPGETVMLRPNTRIGLPGWIPIQALRFGGRMTDIIEQARAILRRQ